MPNYLSASEWETLRKQQKSVKKTGIGDTLKEFEKAGARNDAARQKEALEKTKDNVRGAKTKTATATRASEADIKKYAKKPKDKAKAEALLVTLKKLDSYLDSMLQAVDRELGNLRGAPAQADAEDEDGVDIAALLRKAKILEPPDRSNDNYDKDWKGPRFVVAMAATAGVVLSRRKIVKADIKEARSVIGKSSAKLLMGICYGEGGKSVFDMGKTKCSAGMAKAIARGITAQSGMRFSVLVRGGGIDLDSAMDSEYDDGSGEQPQSPFEEATGIPDPRAQQPAQDAAKPVKYLTKEELDTLLEKFEQIAPERREASFDRIKGILALEVKKAAGDQRMDDQRRNTYNQVIKVYFQRFQRLIPGAQPARGAAPQPPQQAAVQNPYPSADDWNREIDEIESLPLNRAREKAHDIAVRVNLQADRMRMDETSSDDVKAAAQRASDGVARRAADAYKRREQNGRMGEQVKELEILVGQIQSGGGAANALRGELRTAQAKLRGNDQDWLQSHLAPLLDAARRGMAQQNEARFQETKLRERQDVHQRVAPNMQLVMKNTFVEGSARKIIEQRQKELKLDKGFVPVLQAMQACEKDASPENLQKLQDLGRNTLRELQARTPFSAATGLVDKKIDPAIEAQKNLLRQTLLQASLRSLANDYEALGDPANWTPESEQRATELQMKYLFYEGAVTKGGDDPTFGAKPLGGDTKGINQTFWVQRKEPLGGNKDASSLYIAKPAEIESMVSEEDEGLGGGVVIPEIEERAEIQREVFAKDISDALHEATGIDVAVCPTVMVDMDGQFLLNHDGQPVDDKVHKTAVQRLANSDTKISKVIHLDGFAEKIDKKNYDDLAAYDIITGQLDRHGGNIMVEADMQKDDQGRVTGINGPVRMVPIDHGFSLVDAEATHTHKLRTIGAQNFLLNPEMDGKRNQIMSPETRAQIKLMRPGNLSQKLNEANDRIPESERGNAALKPGEILMAERSLAFLQQACDELTVEELFYARNFYSRELAAASEQDLPRVIQECKRKAQAITDFNNIVDIRELPAKSPIENENYAHMRTHGGFDQSAEQMLNEMIENPELVAKWLRVCQPGQKYADHKDQLAQMSRDDVRNAQQRKLQGLQTLYRQRFGQFGPTAQQRFPHDHQDIMRDYQDRIRRFESFLANGKFDEAQCIAVADVRQLQKGFASPEMMGEIGRRDRVRMAQQQAAQG